MTHVRRSPSTVVAGLTGGVGSGKSTAEDLCRQWDIPTADADRWVHELLDGDAEVQRRIADHFRERYAVDARLPDGRIDRVAVATRAFGDPEALRFLEQELHPRVKARAEQWIGDQRRSGVPLAVLIVPLLFESGMERQVDCVIALAVRPEERCRRLRHARGWTDEATRARMSHQLDEQERCRRADYVISNEGTPAQLAEALQRTFNELCHRARRGGS